ncbi:chemotaxis protein CheD [Thermoanaerobacterium thermosaccharolyticum]|uniref:Probable chemoreceptor glutamine deamidase CheD n=3 Tax=Thermoanaerobacterium thermosaccharolyticum TaxID=1517 RepID=D9TMA2_THETC|nr:chemotaxis protein CheD [Thermoanaerobacterium thermosaccharolyticum]ADL68943.1 CheD, stimulates methylation of MCP proteins [Thermoanaerobacterium thermosaccharolyticum DSM 571]AGB19036.1 chemotaxis protein [Thermoanaerobacterium thermosaccharolyticum M0795]KAA5807750.1 chemotaxis protein CheD [Thermoanaerobacterium thermosaccharolyticum]OXT07520.1 chemotaxis protein CheD [Thermoanaerobacterium thermosaccharolyticum]
MDNFTFRVGMADAKIAKCPGKLITVGLGSCVGIVLYDKMTKISGLVHIMLPYSTLSKNNSNKLKFADTGISALIDMMIEAGAEKRYIVSKIAGGAQMFATKANLDIMNIGTRNVIATKDVLASLNIPLISEDTGGNYGRTIEFDSENGKLLIKTIGHGIKFI